MLVIVDEREIVNLVHMPFWQRRCFSTGFCPLEFQEWVATVADADLFAVEAFLLGTAETSALSKMIKDRTRAPVIAMNETPSLEQTLDLFAAGVDDVVRKPIHVREILARVGASGAGMSPSATPPRLANCASFLMAEILNSREFLCMRGASAGSLNIWSITGPTCQQGSNFNSIYGIFDENVEENVVESHISKLRKKLRRQLVMTH